MAQYTQWKNLLTSLKKTSGDVMFHNIQALTLIMGENAICGLPGNVDEE